MRKTRFNGYVYDFSVDYDAISVDEIEIHKYLMKKNNMIQKSLGLLKEKCFILLVLKQVNAVVIVTTLMIHMQKCVFLMLLKT